MLLCLLHDCIRILSHSGVQLKIEEGIQLLNKLKPAMREINGFMLVSCA